MAFYNARYYSPGIIRFISADTIVPDPKNPQTLNRYAYAYNNPVNYTDPSGHMGTPFDQGGGWLGQGNGGQGDFSPVTALWPLAEKALILTGGSVQTPLYPIPPTLKA